MSKPIPELGGKTWEELEVARHASGRLMFKAELRRRNASGKVESIPVRVCVPTPLDKIQARSTARQWFGKIKWLDPERDKELFEEMEQVCILAIVIRASDGQHPQFADHEELAAYEEASLRDIREYITLLEQQIDPREPITSEEQFWRMTFAVARGSTPLPLNDIAGHEQPSCVVRMAKEACHSPTGQRFAQLFGISMLEPSPFPSSEESSSETPATTGASD
jgi:hypothetical protein